MSGSDPVWSDEAIAYLAKHYGSVSPGEIGKRIGVSRNAVIGKAHRLGLASSTAEINRARRPSVKLPAEIMPPPPNFASPTTDRDRHCCWPIGTPGQPGFHYCSQPPLIGKKLCPKHEAASTATEDTA